VEGNSYQKIDPDFIEPDTIIFLAIDKNICLDNFEKRLSSKAGEQVG
jgi:hypothetical protein